TSLPAILKPGFTFCPARCQRVFIFTFPIYHLQLTETTTQCERI
ncbi:hypothetical protein LTSEJOH_2467, partial [Salmonella enterica subsp. enterica serovar Johannesburg str. S5-703]